MRIVEAFVGEYASGKSENAINRSLELLRHNHKVTLVDLDTIEPFYTLRPLKKDLQAMGLNVIAWSPEETMGLGEAGSLLRQEMIWALKNEGSIVLDIGYGVHGAGIFNLIEGAATDPDLKVYAVVNTARPLTAVKEDIVSYIKELGRVDGLINNTHLGDETTPEVVEEGARIVTEAALELGIPVVYTAVSQELAEHFAATDKMGNPVKIIKRYMPQAFW
ncbi:MAG: hypothetical protein ACOX21_02995 [Bacillota bacterium]